MKEASPWETLIRLSRDLEKPPMLRSVRNCTLAVTAVKTRYFSNFNSVSLFCFSLWNEVKITVPSCNGKRTIKGAVSMCPSWASYVPCM